MSIADHLVLGKSLREHVGGRWAISWQMYVINIPINVAGMAASVTNPQDVNVLRWFQVWAVSYLAFGAILFVANLATSNRRAKWPLSIAMVAVIGALAGSVRALAADVAAYYLGLADLSSLTLVSGAFTGAALGAILVPTAALLLSSIATFTAQRRAFVDERVQLTLQIMREQGEAERLRESVLAQVEDQLTTAIAREDIRSARDLSHHLWHQKESARLPRVSLGTVVRRTLTQYPYPMALIAGIWFISAVGTLTASIGVVRGLLQSVASTTAIWVVLAFSKKLSLRNPQYAPLVLVAALTTLILITGPVATLVFDPRPSGSGWSLVLANSLWLPFLSFVIGMVITAVRSGEDILDQLEAEIREEEIEAALAEKERQRVQREVAETIHRLQSRVLVARTSAEEGLSLSVSELLVDPLAGLEPTEQIAVIVGKWGKLLSVKIESLPPDISAAESDVVRRIVDEGIANAYRHGHASSVDVSISRDSDGIEIRVMDDGIGPPAEHRPGLGSAVLESLAPGAWSLFRTPDHRTVLAVELRDSEA